MGLLVDEKFGCFGMKLWKTACTETSTEVHLLADKWKLLLAGLVFQVWFFLSFLLSYFYFRLFLLVIDACNIWFFVDDYCILLEVMSMEANICFGLWS